MLEAGLWAAIGESSLVLGALVAERVSIGQHLVGRAMGFGAGALIAALAYELVPEGSLADIGIWLAFGVGALVYYLLDGFLEARSSGSGGSTGIALALGALLDGVPESLVLGIGVAVGGSVSVGFLAAVFVSNVPESLSSTASLRKTKSATWVYALWIGIVVAAALAGAIGYLLATYVQAIGDYAQALAAGAVLTMLAGSMMPEAFEKGGRVTALVTALGFGIAALLTIAE